jgi:hypothetical protein
LTAQVQFFAVGTSGTNFNISSSTDTHTFNLPTASGTNRGALSSTDWTTFNNKENAITAGTTAQYFRGDKTFQTLNTSVVPELTNLYYTEARVNANTNVAANTAARHNAVTLGTANGLSLSTQVLSLGLASAGVTGALSGTDWSTFNNKQNALTLTTTVTSGADTLVGSTLNIPNYGSALSGYLPLTGGTLTGPLGGTSISLSGDITANRYRGVNSLVLNSYTSVVNPSSNVYLYSPPNDRDAWIYLDSADTSSNWGIYHRQIDSAVSGLPANSIGFIGGGSSFLQAWISLSNGDGYFKGDLTANNLSGTNTGNVTIGTANGLSLSGQALSIGLASGSANGALSSTDWTTFNNKQNALTNPVTGTGESGIIALFTGSTSIGNSVITQSGGDIRIQTSSDYNATFAVNKVTGRNIANFSNGQDADLILTVSDSGAATKFARITPSVSGLPLQLALNNNNVLIGTTDNASFKLDVNGTGRFSSSLTVGAGGLVGRLSVRGTTNDSSAFAFEAANSSGNSLFVVRNDGPATFSSSVTATTSTFAGSGSDRVIMTRTGVGTYHLSISAANRFAIYDPAGDAERISITSGGNVGIGTTNPTTFSGNRTLSINNTAGGAVLELQSNGTSALRMATSASDSALWEPRNVPVLFATNNLERFTIHQNGNLVFKGQSTTAFAEGLFQNTNSGLNFFATNTTSFSKDIGFFTNTTTAQERMRILANGNILIANTSDNGQAIVQIGGSNNTKLSLKDGSSQNGMRWESVGGASTFYLFNGNFGTTGWGLYNVSTASTPLWISNGGDIRINHTGDYSATLSVNKVSGRNVANFSNGADADLNFNVSESGAATKFARISPSVSGQQIQLGINNNNVLIGTTTTIGPAPGRVDVLYSGLVQYGMNIRSSHTDGIAISFVNSSGTQVGTIYQNSSSTAYNTSSDYRLKTDLKDFNGVEIINKIKTYDFEWKTDKTRSYGVIAHELKEVIDYAVFGEKDSVTMQGVDYSKLVPIMVKAIQELKQEINTLKN